MQKLINRVNDSPYLFSFGWAYFIVFVESCILQTVRGMKFNHWVLFFMKDIYSEALSFFLVFFIVCLTVKVGHSIHKNISPTKVKLTWLSSICFLALGTLYISVIGYINSYTTSNFTKLYLSVAVLNVTVTVLVLCKINYLSVISNHVTKKIKLSFFFLGLIMVLSVGRLHEISDISWFILTLMILFASFIDLGYFFMHVLSNKHKKIVMPTMVFKQLVRNTILFTATLVFYPLTTMFWSDNQLISIVLMLIVAYVLFSTINFFITLLSEPKRKQVHNK